MFYLINPELKYFSITFYENRVLFTFIKCTIRHIYYLTCTLIHNTIDSFTLARNPFKKSITVSANISTTGIWCCLRDLIDIKVLRCQLVHHNESLNIQTMEIECWIEAGPRSKGTIG